MKLTIRRSGFVGCALNVNYSLVTKTGGIIAEGICTSMKTLEVSTAPEPMVLRIWQKQARKIVEKVVDICPKKSTSGVVVTIKISMLKLALIFPIIGLFKPTFSIDVVLEYF